VWFLDKLDFILKARVRGRSAIVGCVFAGTLAVSLLVFFLVGNAQVSRVLFFPRDRAPGVASETRLLPRHRTVEAEVRELVEGVLLGPAGHDLARLFPKGVAVRSVLTRRGSLWLDLSPSILAEDSSLALTGAEAFDLLRKTIRQNFPRLRDITLFIDGQEPRFSEGKKS
jgi:hypothetical protein